jgi:NAD(P)-dependent dehydrogenase (short-subunit alcohol dehydrogenase family)
MKTVLVTGSTRGLGRALAARFAESGARIVAHGRHRADLASLAEVRRLAHDVVAACERLDLLVNNAGVGFGAPGAARELSRDGYELRFAVNYLAPFLLTHLLVPLLRASAPARIVNVASIGQSRIDFDDLMLERGYDGARAYGGSKLALIMFTFDLAEALEDNGVTANAIHPATLMNTDMVAQAQIAPRTSVEEGADAVMHLATSPALEGVSGEFFDGRRPMRAASQAYDHQARERLRAVSARLTGLALE